MAIASGTCSAKIRERLTISALQLCHARVMLLWRHFFILIIATIDLKSSSEAPTFVSNTIIWRPASLTL